MSTVASDRVGRRKAGDVRRQALAVGRRLLVGGGPGALTLKAVGAELKMSHANLIHHFGSAEAFQHDLKTFMAEELTRTVTALIEAGHRDDVGELVDLVFNAYAGGGIGILMAWSALTHTPERTREPLEAVGELVAVLESQMEGPDKARRARAMICFVTGLALADSLIGTGLAQIAGGDRRTMRDLTVTLVNQLRRAEPDREPD